MKKTIRPDDQQVAFAKTNVPNLYRHKSGRYYSRLALDGKRQFRSLGTNLKSAALGELKKHEQLVAARRLHRPADIEAVKLRSFADCLELYKTRIMTRPNQREATVTYKLSGVKVLEKTWPAMDEHPRNINIDTVYQWLKQMEADTRYRPPGAKRSSCKNQDQVSNSTYNRNLLSLRKVLDVAVEYGLCVINAARDKSVRQRKYVPKVPELPSAEKFRELVAHLKKSPLPVHREARFLVEFCAYTGARLGTAQSVTWGCVKDDGMFFKSMKGAVDHKAVFVPLNPNAKSLLAEIRQARGEVGDDERILRLGECQKTLTAVCMELGIARLTHHDLRHLFTTRCLEMGIDVPTVSRWLCHLDGGALLMKTYGHLRDEHSRAMAAKVTF
jgi:integrase